MSKEKDVAIFRRFDNLSILCLLSLQAEIIQMEKELMIAYRVEDEAVDQEAANSANFRLARDSGSEQHRKLKALREMIKEYSQ
jgi:hypothetical protein